MHKVLENLRYSKSHEWTNLKDGTITVGISDFASHHIGDVVFVDLPEVGRQFKQGEVFGAVESVKAAADLYSPVSGTVMAVNEVLLDTPEALNEDAYANWIMVIKPNNLNELDALLSPEAYQDHCAKEQE